MIEIESPKTLKGDWVIPFIETMYEDWYILSAPISESGVGELAKASDPYTYEGYYQVAKDDDAFRPTLRWVNGDMVRDLYIKTEDGWLSTEGFLSAVGIELDMTKGGFVLSKRMSRVFRRYLYLMFVDDLKIKYLRGGHKQDKLWDGAGVIHRRVLKRFVLDNVDEDKRAELERELNSMTHVEFTLLHKDGEDKGHAMVSDDPEMKHDFILPKDTKTDIRWNSSEIFIGINPVHGTDSMRLDMQSLINLHPFFDTEYLLQSMREEGELYIQTIEDKDYLKAYDRINGMREDELSDWSIAEYHNSGGNTLWFARTVNAVMNQHVRYLRNTVAEKIRVPIHGGRYYVMTQSVAKAAGIKLPRMGRGKCYIDGDATIYVSDVDWLDHTADILGGADLDDALWCHPFIDTDGKQKLLVWRSPNQFGEYLLLEPVNESHDIEWHTIDGITKRTADSSLLPPRIDQQETTYLNLIQDSGSSLGQGMNYSIDNMQFAIDRALMNRGGLGWVCNLGMVQVAVNGKPFDEAPDKLENVIDSSVKTGDSLAEVKLWCQEFVDQWLANGTPVPALLRDRLTKDESKVVNLTESHWLDTVAQGIVSHIEYMNEQTKRIAAKSTPPVSVIKAGMPYIAMGEQVRETYNTVMRMAPTDALAMPEAASRLKDFSMNKRDREQNRKILYSVKLDIADRVVSEELASMTPTQATQAILGLIALLYTRIDSPVVADQILWLPQVAQYTLSALRDIEVISHIDIVNDRIMLSPRYVQKDSKRLKVNGVWFNALKAKGVEADKPSDIKDKAIKQKAMESVASWAKAGAFFGKTYEVARLEDRQVLTSNGTVMGYIAKEHTNIYEDGSTLEFALVADDENGNLIAIVE